MELNNSDQGERLYPSIHHCMNKDRYHSYIGLENKFVDSHAQLISIGAKLRQQHTYLLKELLEVKKIKKIDSETNDEKDETNLSLNKKRDMAGSLMAQMTPYLSLSTSLLTGTPSYHDKVTILGSRKRKSTSRRRTNQVSPRKRQHFSNSDSDDDDDSNRVTGPVKEIISTGGTTIAHSPIRHTLSISSDESDVQPFIKHTKEDCLILSDEEEASHIQSLTTRTIHHISSDDDYQPESRARKKCLISSNEECGINDKISAEPSNGNVSPIPLPISAWSLEKHTITRSCSVVIDKLPIGAFRFGRKETKMNKQRTPEGTEKSASSSKRELLLNGTRSIIYNYPLSPEIPLQNDPITKQYSSVTDDGSPVVKETPPHKQYSKQSVDVLGLSSSKILFDISDPKCDHSLENETASNRRNDTVLSMQLQDCGKHAKSVNKRKARKSLKRKMKMPGSAGIWKQNINDECPVGSLLELNCPVTAIPLDELITMPVKQSRKRTKRKQQEVKESLPIMEPAIEVKAKRNHRKKNEIESLEKTIMKKKEKSKQQEREPSQVIKTTVRKKKPRQLESDQKSSLEEEAIETKTTKKTARKNTKRAKQQEREPSPIMEVLKTTVRKKKPCQLENDQESSLKVEAIEIKTTKKTARKNTKRAKQQEERGPLLILEKIVENKLKRKPLIRTSSSTVSIEDDPSYTGSLRSSTPIDDDDAGISPILHEDNNRINYSGTLRPCTRVTPTVNEDNGIFYFRSLRSRTIFTPINISETTPFMDGVYHSRSLRSHTRATLVSQATQTTPTEAIEFSRTSKFTTKATPTNTISDHVTMNKSKRTINGKSTNDNRMSQSVHINKDQPFNNNGPMLLVEKVPQTDTESSYKPVPRKGRPLPPQFDKPPLHDRSLKRKEQKDVSISVTHDNEHKESITSQQDQDITMLPSCSPKASFKRKKSSNARPPSYLTTRLSMLNESRLEKSITGTKRKLITSQLGASSLFIDNINDSIEEKQKSIRGLPRPIVNTGKFNIPKVKQTMKKFD